METLVITEDNLEEFEDILPEDVAENIGRVAYRGIAVADDDGSPGAAVVWEYQNLEDDTKDTVSKISWVSETDPDTGKALFDEYGFEVSEDGAVKSTAEFTVSDMEGLKGILTEAGFSFTEKEGGNLIVTVENLSELAIVKKKKVPGYIKPFGTLMLRPYRRGLMNCIFHTKRELLVDLSSLPMDWFDPDLSCYVETDDKITGFLLIHKLPSGRLRVEFVSAFGPDAKTDIIYMMRYAILQSFIEYPGETEVILPRRDVAAKKLTEYFFPGEKGEPSVLCERKE